MEITPSSWLLLQPLPKRDNFDCKQAENERKHPSQMLLQKSPISIIVGRLYHSANSKLVACWVRALKFA